MNYTTSNIQKDSKQLQAHTVFTAKSLFSGELEGAPTTFRTRVLFFIVYLTLGKGSVVGNQFSAQVSAPPIVHSSLSPSGSSFSRPLPPPSVEGRVPKPWPPVSEMPPFSIIHALWSHRRVSMERRATRREGHRHSEPVWWKHGSSGHHLRGHVGHVWR